MVFVYSSLVTCKWDLTALKYYAPFVNVKSQTYNIKAHIPTNILSRITIVNDALSMVHSRKRP